MSDDYLLEEVARKENEPDYTGDVAAGALLLVVAILFVVCLLTILVGLSMPPF